jgi:hypothetical protein
MEGLKEGQLTPLSLPPIPDSNTCGFFFRAPMREPNRLRARAVQLRKQNLSGEIAIGARVTGRGRGIESGGGHNGRSQQGKSEYDDSYNRFNHFQKPPRVKVKSLCPLSLPVQEGGFECETKIFWNQNGTLLKARSLSRRCAGVVHTRGSSPLASPGQ